MSSTNHVLVERQRLQASMYLEFCLGLSKKLVSGKISNQMVMVRRYKRYKEMALEEEDSVRIYRMTGYGEVILFGQNQKLENEEVVTL